MQIAETVIGENLNRYEAAIRSWAAHDPQIAPLVRKVDRARLAAVRQLFAGLGFRGAELEMRTRTFVTYYSLERCILVQQSKRKRLEEVKRRVEIMCQK